MNREERRRAEREEMERYRAEGLPARLSLPAMFAHTAALRRVLEKRDDPLRARRMAEAYHAGYVRSLAHVAPEPRVACKAGCSSCCHNWVPVMAPEALLIAATLRDRPNLEAVTADIAAAMEQGRGLDRDARLERRLACPLLVDHLCSVHDAAWPLACRSFFSLSLDACLAIFRGEAEDLPAWRPAMILRGVHERCMWAALKAVGRPHHGYELVEAVAAALDPGAEARWLAGEDVFAAVTPEAPHDEEEELFLDVLVAGAAGRRLPPNPWTE